MLPSGCACMALVLAAGSSVIRECIESNGTSYNGVQQISSSGQSCLNWLNISNVYNLSIDFNAEPGGWDHSYCRNPDASNKPWCFVAAKGEGIERQDCILETCHGIQDQTKLPNVRLELGESAEVKPDPGLSGKPNLRPNKKKDLGALGYTLGALLMLIIIVLGIGIVFGYFYKKSLKLKMQQEQRATEQEMRRLNLPRSAFCNAACDLAEENRGQTDKEKVSDKHTTSDETEDDHVEKDG